MAGLRLCLKWLSRAAGHYVVWSQSSHQEVWGSGFILPRFQGCPCGAFAPGGVLLFGRML
jgi:hypothetical protein